MSTRYALEADADALAEIYIHTLRDAFGGAMPDDFVHETDVAARSEKIRKSIATGARTWLVSCTDGEIAGFSVMSQSRDDDLPPAHGEIISFGTAAQHRRKGHGDALMRAAFDEATKRGWRALALWVVDRNAGARALYEKHGFRFDGTTRVDDRLGFEATVVRYRT
jgi:ribosomal protein S18 acetylase RimI-like enzyme